MQANSTVIASRLFRSQRYMFLLIISVFVSLLIITSVAGRDYVDIKAIPDRVSGYYEKFKGAAAGVAGSTYGSDNLDEEGESAEADAPSDEDYAQQENDKIKDDNHLSQLLNTKIGNSGTKTPLTKEGADAKNDAKNDAGSDSKEVDGKGSGDADKKPEENAEQSGEKDVED